MLLEVKDLKVHFALPRRLWNRQRKFVAAVDGVSFTIGEGETLGLVGESGCGKSTTARAILQLLNATSGSVKFEGAELLGLSQSQLKNHRRAMQMVFQNPFSSLNPRMTIAEILSEPLKSLTDLNSKQILKRVYELMEVVRLDPEFLFRYPHEFSGGQRQRINIARALAVNPKLIVLDEPVSALDVSIQAQIINLLQDLQNQFRVAFLFIAHDLSVVKTLSQRVAVMYLGKIVEVGLTEKVFSDPRHPYTQALLSAVPVPDPKKERARQRIKLEGEVPSPVNLPNGCRFHPRCRLVEVQCKKDRPELQIKASGAEAACFVTR